jgi:hypothetical protein
MRMENSKFSRQNFLKRVGVVTVSAGSLAGWKLIGYPGAQGMIGTIRVM